MAKVRIFHNVSADASFGLNSVFRKGPEAPEGVRAIPLQAGGYAWKGLADGPDERHPLVLVFEYDAEYPGDNAETYPLLDQAFERFNVGCDELAAQYRARRLRSLSVGDVVEIDGDAYSCDSAGWSPVSRDDLRVVKGAEAEAIIRARFEYRPHEQIAITVPLTEQEA